MKNTLESSLVQLGEWFRGEIPNQGPNDELLLSQAEMQNRWFNENSCKDAMHGCGAMLEASVLLDWLRRYHWSAESNGVKRIGLVLAGNLPLVGWHDVLCTLLTGHEAVIKASSSDSVLMASVVEAWQSFLPKDTRLKVEWVTGKMSDVDAVIATGSANTNRYFEHYFKGLPRILRSQRTSVAILNGSESDEEIQALGRDVFQYFGMGCRSVTKLYLPVGFDLNRLFKVWIEWSHLANHNKYANNYDYHKAVWLLNQVALIENGFVLLKEDKAFLSPVGSLFYESFSDVSSLMKHLDAHASDLQCIAVRNPSDFRASAVPIVHLGRTQMPMPWDYADGVDTISFLLELSSSQKLNPSHAE
jgi:hypothetical protein